MDIDTRVRVKGEWSPGKPFAGKCGTVVTPIYATDAFAWPVWVHLDDSAGLDVASNPSMIYGFNEAELEEI